MSGSAIQQQEKDKAQKILTETIRMPDNKVCKYYLCMLFLCASTHVRTRGGSCQIAIG